MALGRSSDFILSTVGNPESHFKINISEVQWGCSYTNKLFSGTFILLLLFFFFFCSIDSLEFPVSLTELINFIQTVKWLGSTPSPTKTTDTHMLPTWTALNHTCARRVHCTGPNANRCSTALPCFRETCGLRKTYGLSKTGAEFSPSLIGWHKS